MFILNAFNNGVVEQIQKFYESIFQNNGICTMLLYLMYFSSVICIKYMFSFYEY